MPTGTALQVPRHEPFVRSDPPKLTRDQFQRLEQRQQHLREHLRIAPNWQDLTELRALEAALPLLRYFVQS